MEHLEENDIQHVKRLAQFYDKVYQWKENKSNLISQRKETQVKRKEQETQIARFRVISAARQAVTNDESTATRSSYHVQWLDAIREKPEDICSEIPKIQATPLPRDNNDTHDYVYDIYIEETTPMNNPSSIDQLSSIEGYLDADRWQDWFHGEDEVQEDDDTFDEEDSNAEDYWMNDYPDDDMEDDDNNSRVHDEDEEIHIYDELGIRIDGHADIKEDRLMQHYENNIIKNFADDDYQEIEELSTDDEQDFVYWNKKLKPKQLSKYGD
jgi:hypothetical protein